ncbi:MAG: dockerin type I repeat-containing protein [Prevotellaceae bacterium]|nr:dockerin type I repeat-containing protein [Prevotellaceae bacterium]
MKKIFTSIAMLALCAMAHAQYLEMDGIRTVYTTCDTIFHDDMPDGLTASMLVPGFNSLNIPFEDIVTNDLGYKWALTQDYQDPETGFMLNKGYYKFLTVNTGTLNFAGKTESDDYTAGMTNLKKVILYCVGLPNAKNEALGINHADLSTGRLQARYNSPTLAEDGTAVPMTNEAYREIKVQTKIVKNEEDWTKYIYTYPNFLDFKCSNVTGDEYDPRFVSVNSLFKITYDLTGDVDTKALEEFMDWGESHNGSEYNNLNIDGMTEATIKYYFAKHGECSSSVDPATYVTAADAATGYNCFDKKWGPKVAWTAETPIQVKVKNRIILAGISFVSGDDTPMKWFGHANDPSGDWTGNPDLCNDEYYGNPCSDMDPEKPWGVGIDPTPAGLLGDADEDGVVSVSDITTVASYILGGNPSPFNATNADVDKDGLITVSDITGIAGIILGTK